MTLTTGTIIQFAYSGEASFGLYSAHKGSFTYSFLNRRGVKEDGGLTYYKVTGLIRQRTTSGTLFG